MGDKKYVINNTLWKTLPPIHEYPGEKNYNPHSIVIQLSKNYKFKPVNKCLCVVDYQQDGMTANNWSQYVNSPNSFADLRKQILEVDGLTFLYRTKTVAHYVASSRMAKRKNIIRKSPRVLMTIICYPLGILFEHIILKNYSKENGNE